MSSDSPTIRDLLGPPDDEDDAGQPQPAPATRPEGFDLSDLRLRASELGDLDVTVNLRVKRDGFIDVPRGGVVMVSPRTGLWVGVVQPRACAECAEDVD